MTICHNGLTIELYYIDLPPGYSSYSINYYITQSATKKLLTKNFNQKYNLPS